MIKYLVTIALSVLFLVIGNRLAVQDSAAIPYYDEFSITFVSARVTEILSHTVVEMGHGATMTTIIFEARITNGGLRGEIITAEHTLTDMFIVQEREVELGDRVILFYDDFSGLYYLAALYRIQFVIALAVIFFILVVAFAKVKGLNSILSLVFILAAILLVFVPAILGGRNIYVVTVLICFYAILSTLFIVIGVNRKAFASILGCAGGVVLAGVLMFIMDRLTRLTGFVDDESVLLTVLENPVDLRAVVFAGVVIGAVGAIMDVAMSISTSLWELHKAGGVSDFGGMFKSGINIGKDILGTMLNTLVLAYIGSSMSLILLVAANAESFSMLFNMEMIIVEFLRALVGSFGMLLAIPLTAVICAALFSRKETGKP